MARKEKSAIGKMLDQFASRKVIEKAGSRVNPVLEVLTIGDKLLLNSANTNYSYGGLHRVFQKVFTKIDIPNDSIKDVLILGFGAGSVASILIEEMGVKCSLKGVEKDEEVIRLGKKHFDTARFSDLELIQDDAAKYMRSENKKYDLIVVDVYVDFEVPASCETQGFVKDLERSLLPGGIILFNKLVYNHKAGEEAKELLAKFKKLAGSTKIIKVKENIVNRIIVYEDIRPNTEHRAPNTEHRKLTSNQ